MRMSLVMLVVLFTATARADEKPIVVASSPKAGGHIHPSICQAKDGTLVVVFKGPQVLLCSRSTDGGATWEEPKEIPTTAKRPESIRPVKIFEVYPGTADTMPDGSIVVTWNYIADDKAKDGYYERALLYTISKDQGRTWSEQGLVGPVNKRHLNAVRHNVLPWVDGQWLLPIRAHVPRTFDPKTGKTEEFHIIKGSKTPAFQQITRTAKGSLLALGQVFLRSTDDGKTWNEVKNFPAPAEPIDNAEGRYLTALKDGKVLVTWGPNVKGNKGLRFNMSSDDGQTWTDEKSTVTLLPETAIPARYYSARTIQIDDRHVGTVFLTGSVVNFLKTPISKLTP